eukprot:gene12649-13948_t
MNSMMSVAVVRLVVSMLVCVMLVSCEEKVSGQPTHFQMDDRSPELEIDANNEGVKIKAKPATLQVMSHPEEVHIHEPEEIHTHVIRKMPHFHISPPIVDHVIQPIYYGGNPYHHHRHGNYYDDDYDDQYDGEEEVGYKKTAIPFTKTRKHKLKIKLKKSKYQRGRHNMLKKYHKKKSLKIRKNRT